MKTFLEAQVRALWQAFISGGGMFFLALQTGSGDRDAFILAGGAFFLALGFRGGVEGALDARKASAQAKLEEPRASPIHPEDQPPRS